jgi:hypothetical protein
MATVKARPARAAAVGAGGTVRDEPKLPKAKRLSTAGLFCVYAHRTAKELIGVYDASRTGRRKGGGQTTDAEQDLLRASLVFASAGLDATLKQIVKDTLPEIINRNPKARKQLSVYTSRQLRKSKEKEAATATVDADFLASILTGDSPKAVLTERFAAYLTANSLQSAEQVETVARELGIEPKEFGVATKDLKDTFDVRNQIVHEMDLDPAGKQRKRVSRRREDMLVHINRLLALAEAFLNSADKVLV